MKNFSFSYPGVALNHWCTYCCTPQKIQTRTNNRKRIKDQDLKLKREETVMNQCNKNCIFSRIYQFLWNFVLAKIYPPQVVGYKCKIGGILSFVNGHHVSFWAKVFMSFCNFWAFVAYRYGGEVFSIHIKRKLQEQDNLNLV